MEEQSSVKEVYGYEWPNSASAASIELQCFHMHRTENDFDTGHTPAYHFIEAAKHLFPEYNPNGTPLWISSRDSQRRLTSFVENGFQTWWGPAAAGKTTDAAVCVWTYFLACPEQTSISVCSTDKKMLMRRIWGELVRFYDSYCERFGEANMPVDYLRGEPAFLYRSPGATKATSRKSGIFGIPIQAGEVDKAVGCIKGCHNTFTGLVIDEMQASYWAAVAAWENLSTGCIQARFLGMGNPVSKLDPLGRASRPKAGWNSISPERESWETPKGVTLYFDGLKSPGVTNPKRYPFLLSAKDIEATRKDPGENSPAWWTERRGFLPPDGLTQTVFTESLFTKMDLGRKVDWAEKPMDVAAMDESFVIGGDRCIFQMAKIGMTTQGVLVIWFGRTISVNLELHDDLPIEYFVAARVREHCMAHGIPPTHFGLDVSGQQSAMAAIVEKEWGAGIFRCAFQGLATENPASESDPRPGKEVYADRVSELYYQTRYFATAGQIAGLSEDAAREFCQRLVLPEKKIAVESKRDMKHRTGMSPDIADAHVIIVAMAVERFGMKPGSNNFGDRKQPITDEVAQYYDVNVEEKLYMEDDEGVPNIM